LPESELPKKEIGFHVREAQREAKMRSHGK